MDDWPDLPVPGTQASFKRYQPQWWERARNLITDASIKTEGKFAGMARGLMDAVRAPQMALDNEYQFVDERGQMYRSDGNGGYTPMFDDAANMAGLIGMGSVVPRPNSLTNLASRSANIYDPPVKSPRSFEADYPSGALADVAGKLVQDIDGRQLSAPYVVGRQRLSGPDVALPPEALDEIAKARTGETIRSIAPGRSGIGQDMGRAVFGSDGRPDYVAVSKSLAEPQRSRVAAHEIGHVLDQTAGEIPTAGLNNELRGIYNSLNNPQTYGKSFGPEQSRYRGADVQRELMAEAIRAYMADPNYIKTVAPNTALRIRASVNDNPKLMGLIQFNASGLPVVKPVGEPHGAGVMAS